MSLSNLLDAHRFQKCKIAGPMAGALRDFTVGNTETGENGITQVGVGNVINYADPIQERRRIQEWFAWWLLEFKEPNTRSQPQIVKEKGSAAHGTGLWLTQDILPAWLESTEDALWVHGDVGSGKSILCLREYVTTTKDILSIPIIFSFDATHQDSPDFFHRTCLAFLCALTPIPLSIQTAIADHLSAAYINDIGALVLNVLNDIATDIKRPRSKPLQLVAVIDAVDERSSSVQQNVLRYLNLLLESNKNDKLVRFRSILFTRESLMISQFCRSSNRWRKQEIPSLALNQDILTAVSSSLADNYNFQSWPADKRKDLAIQIATRANGMFRLAALYVDYLIMIDRRQIPKPQLENMLADLPDELYPFYDRILWQVKIPFVRQQSFNSLRWICFSARPLSLCELRAACAISLPNGYKEADTLDIFDLLKPLSGLIRVDPPLPEDHDKVQGELHIVSLAHFSVEEYLKAHIHVDFSIDTTFFDRSTGNIYLARACITYAAQGHFKEPMYKQHDPTNSLKQYSIDFWTNHLASHVQSKSPEQSLYQRLSITSLALRIRNACLYNDLEFYEDADDLEKEANQLICSVVSQQHYLELLRVLLAKPLTMFSPLKSGQMRLLLLRPDIDGVGRVQCEEVIDSIENKARYTFLSYMWGGYRTPNLVTLNGLEVDVTNSLYKALLFLRQDSKLGAIWVDQLCINQQDSDERNYQVRRLSSTITGASVVYCWIASMLEEQAGQVPSSILQDSIWTRTWIMQELILARKVIIKIEERSFDWNAIVKLAETRTSALSPVERNAAQNILLVQATRQARNSGGTELSLEALVYRFRNTRSMNPSDKIFAFVGLNFDRRNVEELIDYRLSTIGLYARFGEQSIRGCQSLDILSINNSTLPDIDQQRLSWVPRWHKDIEQFPLAPGVFDPQQPQLFQASKAPFAIPSSFEPLTMKAILVARICRTASIADFLNVNQMLSMENDTAAMSSNLILISEHINPRVLIRTILEGRVMDPQLNAFRRIIDSDIQAVIDLTSRNDTDVSLDQFSWSRIRRNRQICWTERGHIANVPLIAQEGDLIVVFPYARTPHVVRSCQVLNLAADPLWIEYIFVGECYMDSYMDGEAELEHQAGHLSQFECEIY